MSQNRRFLMCLSAETSQKPCVGAGHLNKDSGVLLLCSHATAALGDRRRCLVSLPKEASRHATRPPEPVRGVICNNGCFSQADGNGGT